LLANILLERGEGSAEEIVTTRPKLFDTSGMRIVFFNASGLVSNWDYSIIEVAHCG